MVYTSAYRRRALTRPPPCLEVVEVVRERLLADEDLPHIWGVTADLPILVASAARDRDLNGGEAVALELLDLFLKLGVVPCGDVVVMLRGGAGGGGVGLASGALVAVDVEVDGGDGLGGPGGGACVGNVGPAWRVGGLGRGYLDHAEVIHHE